MKNLFLLCFIALIFTAKSQELKFDKDKLMKANEKLESARKLYLKCATNSDLKTCADEYVKTAKDPYEKNVVANVLFNSDTKTSYRLHKEAYEANPKELIFNLEYALELHRNEEYKLAARLYEALKKPMNNEYKLYVWLADCYINMGETNRAIMNWDSADHPKNHTGIEEAIHSIYERTDQFKRRDSLRKLVAGGKIGAAYELIHFDFNWEYNWWNMGKIGDDFYKEDVALIKKALSKSPEDLKAVEAYIKLKKLTEENLTEEEKLEALMKTIKESESDKKTGDNNDTIKRAKKIKEILTSNELMLDGKTLPKNGKILSDMVNLCLENKVILENDFLSQRGKEILATAMKNKDPDMLNLYAYLSESIPDSLVHTDSIGWMEFGQERFALGFLRHKVRKIKSDGELIQKAIRQFSNSSKIYLIYVFLLATEKLPLNDALIELIRRDLKTIDSGSGTNSAFGIGHNSYALKNHFEILKNSLKNGEREK